jgi:hypothetical protein
MAFLGFAGKSILNPPLVEVYVCHLASDMSGIIPQHIMHKPAPKTPKVIKVQKSGLRPGAGGGVRRARRRFFSPERSLGTAASSSEFLLVDDRAGFEGLSDDGDAGESGNGEAGGFGKEGGADAESGTRNMARHPPQRTSCVAASSSTRNIPPQTGQPNSIAIT